jgi:hypothetical protein
VPKRCRAIAVAEASRDRAEIHACCQQFGCGVVTQRVQVRVDAQTIGQSREAVRECARAARPRSVRCRGEDKASGSRATPTGASAFSQFVWCCRINSTVAASIDRRRI